MQQTVVKKSNKLGAGVWLSVILFGLVGQLAWMVENMYFSTFIQKNITKDPVATSATVAASAIVAALATIFGGAWSDRAGNRRTFISVGYILWGAITAAFAFFGNEKVSSDVTLAVVVFVIMDCVMTLFGSISNDAAFSAWVTDVTDITNRSIVDVVLSIMPIAALMIIFVALDGLTANGNWVAFYLIIGGFITLCGVAGLFFFRDSPNLSPSRSGAYMKEVIYGFTPRSVKENKMIYWCFAGTAFSALSMQMWQPYMITLIEYTVGIKNYVIPIGIIVVLSAGLSVLGGKLMDKYGKEKFFFPVSAIGVLGGAVCYVIKFCDQQNEILKLILLVVGGTLVMGGSLMCAGLFGAAARDYTPEGKAGCFQGVRIVLCVTLPMVVSSIVLPFIINGFGGVPTQDMIDAEIYQSGDKTYPYEMFLFAAIVALLVFLPAAIVRRRDRQLRASKLAEMNSSEDSADSE